MNHGGGGSVGGRGSGSGGAALVVMMARGRARVDAPVGEAGAARTTTVIQCDTVAYYHGGQLHHCKS